MGLKGGSEEGGIGREEGEEEEEVVGVVMEAGEGEGF